MLHDTVLPADQAFRRRREGRDPMRREVRAEQQGDGGCRADIWRPPALCLLPSDLVWFAPPPIVVLDRIKSKVSLNIQQHAEPGHRDRRRQGQL